MKNFGKVYLIGAGPGDPGLFTLKGKSILERADVVVYDRLVSPAILSFCNASAEMVDVGKMPTHHKVKQSEINKLLVKFAQENPGATIARLKGGDPFVFGRGGEEALELIDAGVEFEVVPGITSAISVPAYAGIPVSHRGIATSFHIVTGHEKQEMQTCHSELYETKNFSSQVELCPLGRSTKCEVEESRILILQGNLADDTILKLLPKATRWVVYETLPVATLPDWKREAVAGADAVVFASSSAVENFMNALKLPQSTEGAASNLSAQRPHLAFSIGRLTSATAKKYDFEVVESEETSMDSLVKKITEYYAV